MAKSPSEKNGKTPEKSLGSVPFDQMNKDLREATGKLLETTGVMHSFMQSLQASGFKEYIDYLGSPWRAFWINFAMGVARGLGFVIGATVVVAIVVWIISQVLTQLPIVGDFFETLQEFLSEDNLRNVQSGNLGDTFSRMFDAFKTNVLENTPQ
ncbi:MAG: DUF5665 domain-containing protein [Candidatus Altimarinota bacterium]